jgi:hypothetical protein
MTDVRVFSRRDNRSFKDQKVIEPQCASIYINESEKESSDELYLNRNNEQRIAKTNEANFDTDRNSGTVAS